MTSNSSASSAGEPLPGKNPSPMRPAAGGHLGVAPDHDRHRGLRRLRVAEGRPERGELAVVARPARRSTGPACTRCGRRGAGPARRRAPRSRRTPPRPNHADAGARRPPGQRVERGALLGQHHRVALRHDEDAVARLIVDVADARYEHRDERVRDGGVVVAGHLAGLVVGVLRLVALGHQHVLDSTDGLEPGVLAALAMAIAPSGCTNGPTLANITPNFMVLPPGDLLRTDRRTLSAPGPGPHRCPRPMGRDRPGTGTARHVGWVHHSTGSVC